MKTLKNVYLAGCIALLNWKRNKKRQEQPALSVRSQGKIRFDDVYAGELTSIEAVGFKRIHFQPQQGLLRNYLPTPCTFTGSTEVLTKYLENQLDGYLEIEEITVRRATNQGPIKTNGPTLIITALAILKESGVHIKVFLGTVTELNV